MGFNLEDHIRDFISKTKSSNRHEAKLLILAEMLKNVFKLTLEEIIPSVEKYLKSGILGIRGSVDLLFNDVIFELKLNFEREYEDGIKEIEKYSRILREKNPETEKIPQHWDLF